MFNEFSLYVYDRNLTFLGIIDTFTSLRWRRKYFEAGEFELHIPLDSRYVKYLHEDNIIVRTDAVEAGIIENWQIKDDGKKVEVTIIGRFLSSILDRRIVKQRINYYGNFLDGEREILNKMTPFPNLIIQDTTLETPKTRFQCTYKVVYDQLKNLAKASTVAHRIIPDIENKKLIYQNYQGLDRTGSQKENTRYEFSEDMSNIENATYTFNAKTKENYALVGGQGEGEERILVEIKDGENTGYDLRETFIDASSEQMDEETSLEDYKEQLTEYGKDFLLKETENVDVTVYSRDYRKRWDLGDIVDVKKESWGITLKERITEIEEVIESNNQKVCVVFGTPLAEALTDE